MSSYVRVLHYAASRIQKPAEYSTFLAEGISRAIAGMVEVGSEMEMAIFAKDEMEVKNLLPVKLPVQEPAEPTSEVQINGETEAQKRTRNIKNQEKLVALGKNLIKVREKGVLCYNIPWDDADAKVRNYAFPCLETEVKRQLQQKRPNLNYRTTTIKDLTRILDDISYSSESQLSKNTI